MTTLTEDEREAYAKPGTLLHRMLDEGVVPWPTREELVYEEAALGFLKGEDLNIGTLLAMMEAAEDGPRSDENARYGPNGPRHILLSSHDDTDAPHDIKRK